MNIIFNFTARKIIHIQSNHETNVISSQASQFILKIFSLTFQHFNSYFRFVYIYGTCYPIHHDVSLSKFQNNFKQSHRTNSSLPLRHDNQAERERGPPKKFERGNFD